MFRRKQSKINKCTFMQFKIYCFTESMYKEGKGLCCGDIDSRYNLTQNFEVVERIYKMSS